MLKNITSAQLKKMTREQLYSLCEELRETIISTVMKNGGHLSSNLGVVELTVALHYVFDFPDDKIIFDVGHQCYAHKLLSGRAEKFGTLRQRGGLSGFPKREESEYDCYNTGHAGTAVSAALGFAKARDIQGGKNKVVAVIGDGSFNNGLVYEAFNSLKPLNTNILVILNDNGMSISPTVGSMHEYLVALSDDSLHRQKKQNHENIFKRFGFSYDGVYDGNDLDCMIERLTDIKGRLETQSVILHVLTKKGKGYSFCEEDPEATHGIATGNIKSVEVEYSEILGKTLCKLAESNPKIVAVTAAMTPSLGLSEFFTKFPERAIDVGICEEHAVILGAGLAAQGLKPYYAVYSTFLQRSIDEILIDVCSQNLPFTVCIDRAGVSGADGETHQGVFDLSFLTSVPNLTIAVPKDTEEFARMLEFSAQFDAPLAIRYPREGKSLFSTHGKIECGKWERLITEKGKFVLIACGERAVTVACRAQSVLKERNIAASVINARFVKPLDTQMLDSIDEKYIITIEDNMLIGGFGALVDVYFSQSDKIIKNFAYNDRFIPHGNVRELMREFGVCDEDVINYVIENAD